MQKDCKVHALESKAQLKSGGLKITPARLAVLDVFKHAKKPLSVKELAKLLTGPDPDIVTLYRNLEVLEKLGLLQPIQLQDQQVRYELAGDHHHHLVCEVCGKVVDVKDCDFGSLPKGVIKKSGFATVNRHSLEFFGTCSNCAHRNK